MEIDMSKRNMPKRFSFAEISDDLRSLKLELYFTRCKIALGDVSLVSKVNSLKKDIARTSGIESRKKVVDASTSVENNLTVKNQKDKSSALAGADSKR
jgi:ribosomal protein L29